MNSSGGTLGVVEHHGRPELDVGGEHAVGLARPQLGERGLLELLGDVEAGRADLARRAAQHPGARVLGAVDAVAEAHQPVARVERALDPAFRVPLGLDLVEHGQHARGGAAVQRPGQRAHPGGERGGDVGAGRGDHAHGEGGGVHAVLRGRDPVGVDRLDVLGVGLAAPADQEALGDRGGLVDLALRDRRAADAAGRLGDEGEGHHGDARQVVAGPLVADVDQRLQPPLGGEHGERRLEVDARVARAHGQRVRLGRGHARVVAAVDEQAPDLLERHVADELLDVHAAVAQRAALLVGLGDGRVERDYAFEP